MENYLEITGDNFSRRPVFIPQAIDKPYDITLVVDDGKKIKVHRRVLSEASPVFEKMLTSEIKETHEGVVLLEMITELGLMELLEYIYTCSVPISADDNAQDFVSEEKYLRVVVTYFSIPTKGRPFIVFGCHLPAWCKSNFHAPEHTWSINVCDAWKFRCIGQEKTPRLSSQITTSLFATGDVSRRRNVSEEERLVFEEERLLLAKRSQRGGGRKRLFSQATTYINKFSLQTTNFAPWLVNHLANGVSRLVVRMEDIHY